LLLKLPCCFGGTARSRAAGDSSQASARQS